MKKNRRNSFYRRSAAFLLSGLLMLDTFCYVPVLAQPVEEEIYAEEDINSSEQVIAEEEAGDSVPEATVTEDAAAEGAETSDPAADEEEPAGGEITVTEVMSENETENSISENDSNTVSAGEPESTGYIPVYMPVPETYVPKDEGIRQLRSEVLPSSYETPNLTSVKNQGNEGICWAYAAAAVLEQSAVKELGVNPEDIDLDEAQIAATFNNYDSDNSKKYTEVHYAEPLNLTSGDSVRKTGDGGNNLFTTFMLASQVSPIYQGKDVSSGYDDREYSLREAKFIALENNDNYIEEIKQAIKDYGAVSLAIDSYDYNSSGGFQTYGYRSPNDKYNENHAVTLVGWDDTISADKFSHNGTEDIPSRDGGFKFKNSWGTKRGENGFQWISYVDRAFLKGLMAVVYKVGEANDFDTVYEYDGSYGLTRVSVPLFSNRFTARESYESIIRAGFGIYDPGEYTAAVILKDEENNGENWYTKVEKAEVSQNFTATNAGYWSVDFEDPATVRAGQEFAVAIYKADKTEFKLYVDKTGQNGDWIFFTVDPNNDHVFGGQFSGHNNLISQSLNLTPRIKAFTKDAPEGIPPERIEFPDLVSTDGLRFGVTETAKVRAKVYPTGATNKTLVWESADETVATVSSTGIVTGVAPGSTKITVAVKDTTVSASFDVTVCPQAPSPAAAVDAAGNVNITWPAIGGADKYKVFRGGNADTGTLVEEVTATNSTEKYSVTDTYYAGNEPDPGSKILYYVYVYENGVYSEFGVYANFSPKHTITYDLGGGTNDPANPSIYREGQTISLKPAVPADDTKYFYWWYTGSDKEVSKNSIISSDNTDLTFRARYETKGDYVECDHSYGEGEVTTKPTPLTEGVMTYVCTRCGHIKTEAIPRTEDGNDYTELIEDTKELSGNTAAKIEENTKEDGTKELVVKIGNEEVSKTITDPVTGKETVVTSVWIGGLSDSYTYTGKAIKPELHVYDGVKLLTEKKDYKLSFKNNKNAGTATVTVKFTGNLSSESNRTLSYTIKPAELGTDILACNTATAYNKKVQKPVPALVWAATGKTVSKKYFDISYDRTVQEIGEYTATISPKSGGNFSGSTTASINVAGGNDSLLSKAKVTFDSKSYAYTGSAIVPGYTLTLGGRTLTEGRDYVRTNIWDNTLPGTATVEFEALDISTNSAPVFGIKRATFKITGKRQLTEAGSNSSFTYTYQDSVAFTKGGAKPSVVVRDGGQKLTEGKDYTLSYTGNKAVTAGQTAQIQVKGKGSYKGTVTLAFAVTEQDLSALSSNILITDQFKPKDKVKTPGITIRDLNGKTLSSKTDFYVKKGPDLTGSSDSGTGTVVIAGKGSYKGEVTAAFRYDTSASANIAKMKAGKISDKVYTGTEITLEGSDLANILYPKGSSPGSALEYGKDFVIAGYSGNVKIGTARVTLRGTGGYAGTKTLKFKIIKKPVNYKGALVSGEWQ